MGYCKWITHWWKCSECEHMIYDRDEPVPDFCPECEIHGSFEVDCEHCDRDARGRR
jgi:acetyl-CoA carboxylase beta subunit